MALVISEARWEAPELLPGELIFAGISFCLCPVSFPRGVCAELNRFKKKVFIAHPLWTGCGGACELLSV